MLPVQHLGDVALLGRPNAGKSTLFNRLTGAEVMAKDLLFATLDTTQRTIRLPQGRPAIIADTVGFVSDLPHELVESFRATLEEVADSDLLLHVVDGSHPDPESQISAVRAVLADPATAEGAAALIAAGAIDGLSIGYRTVRAERDRQGRRVLTEVELWEVSLVTFPMLREAKVGRKSEDLGEDDLAEALRAATEALRR